MENNCSEFIVVVVMAGVLVSFAASFLCGRCVSPWRKYKTFHAQAQKAKAQRLKVRDYLVVTGIAVAN